jgi:hypothetical protein
MDIRLKRTFMIHADETCEKRMMICVSCPRRGHTTNDPTSSSVREGEAKRRPNGRERRALSFEH